MTAQLKLVSSAFEHGASIPKRYTCEGEDLSPPRYEWGPIAVPPVARPGITTIS